MAEVRIAVDVGGTFTDVVKLVPDTGELRFEKVATTPSEPTRGVLAAFDAAEAPLGEVSTFNHGSTLGLNSLLTRTGARVAVVATAGFRDVYLLGRTDRKAMYDLTYRKPEPLLRRRDTFEVVERCTFDGEVLTAFDERDARAVARRIAEGGYDAVAVAFLHAYANPEHERAMRRVLQEVAPQVEVTLSHELSREYREYERTSTAVLDAYIKPVMRTYLTALGHELADGGFTGRFLMSRSGGGAMTASAAAQQPVNLILSGPAGGVVGAAALSKLIGYENLITIDMGGTSLDASLVLDGEPVLHAGAQFEGMPINTTSLNIHTIGAGGGSVAHLDAAGALQVGPRSAGAAPGPAAYGRGGTEPTFTDAALVLGYMGSDSPLGGSLQLDHDLASKALQPIAHQLDMSLPALARGIVRISTTKIVGAVRAITVELGRDPKDFALLSFGGGGGLVAVDVARELNIPTVVVPPGQGAFSALGMLMADVQHDYSRTSVVALDATSPADLEVAFQQMEDQARVTLTEEGFAVGDQEMHRSVDVRYVGQEHAATVPYPGEGDGGVLTSITRDFRALHERLYGHVMDEPAEIATLRLRAVGVVDKPKLPACPVRTQGAPTPFGRRPVFLSGDEGEYYDLYTREALQGGDVVHGPAVIAEHTATTVLHRGDRLEVAALGELVIHVRVDDTGTSTDAATRVERANTDRKDAQ
ncbi:hydantoinase/oxoprolinase family protein [Paenibacillus sp. TRM 82003]|uniref:hydantoinase/oxoprolinase family protein n=1 Tax=Kineococcus sp. TRM81007 TaxID=2925831 RepID=UPI001F57C09A|nr:hydantoinase/oxoprolinase family protein [Kineococcus sp. TRM81007]MCI2239040.1 hydantoinase/oxoprolinase family protein [Kineococcus sp. TRM81007]MCI3924460.1 hydantoinase/oxoprolinase family protein [Paenibacillus sp. TRM 82003]